MFSFRAEYSLRILAELERQRDNGVEDLPVSWFLPLCGNDQTGLSILLRQLQSLGWISCHSASRLYTLRISPKNLSLYDFLIQVGEHRTLMPKVVYTDFIGQNLKQLFSQVWVSELLPSVKCATI